MTHQKTYILELIQLQKMLNNEDKNSKEWEKKARKLLRLIQYKIEDYQREIAFANATLEKTFKDKAILEVALSECSKKQI